MPDCDAARRAFSVPPQKFHRPTPRSTRPFCRHSHPRWETPRPGYRGEQIAGWGCQTRITEVPDLGKALELLGLLAANYEASESHLTGPRSPRAAGCQRPRRAASARISFISPRLIGSPGSSRTSSKPSWFARQSCFSVARFGSLICEFAYWDWRTFARSRMVERKTGLQRVTETHTGRGCGPRCYTRARASFRRHTADRARGHSVASALASAQRSSSPRGTNRFRPRRIHRSSKSTCSRKNSAEQPIASAASAGVNATRGTARTTDAARFTRSP